MTDNHRCESCSMPIESGPYCQHCVDETGKLQPFEQRFERMVAWQARRSPEKNRETLEAETLAFMAKMPAWQNHPKVRAAGHVDRGPLR